MSGSCRKPKDPVREFFVQVHFCTMPSHFSLPATHENVVTQCHPPPYDNTPDRSMAAPCPRSDACSHPPPPMRPWRSRERPLGGIGSGGQYFAGSGPRRPHHLPLQYLVPGVSNAGLVRFADHLLVQFYTYSFLSYLVQKCTMRHFCAFLPLVEGFIHSCTDVV